jgi:hypothetical protein
VVEAVNVEADRCGHPDVGDVCTRPRGHAGDHAGDVYSWPPNPWPGGSDDDGVTVCGVPHPDWRMSCDRAPHDDAVHENDGETWTDDQAPVDRAYDERTEFWTGWLHVFIVWATAGLVCLIALPALHHAIARDVVEVAGIFAGLQVGRLIWQAAAFWWED